MTHKRSFGFTLIEVLVAATIIVVLASIGIVSYRNIGISVRDSKRKADLDTVRSALVLYRSEQGSYPSYSGQTRANFTNMAGDLESDGYLSDPLPSDPRDNASYFYTYSSSGTTFTLEATLEEDDSVYQLTNP